MDIQWLFHTLYNPQAAGMIERCNSLLKQGLQVSRHLPMMHDWALHLWEVLRTSNEKPRREGSSPVEALLHSTAALVQLQVNTSEALLKPAYVRNGNILLPVPACLKAGERQQWTWPWRVKSSHCPWLGLVDSWGAGLIYELQGTPGVVSGWQTQVVYGGPDVGTILRETFVLSLWPIMGSPLLLHVETMQGSPSDVVKVWYHKPGKLPMAVTLLS